VVKGESFVDPDSAQVILKGLSADANSEIKLRGRHIEVLMHLAEDLSTQEIAAKMVDGNGNPLTIHTVNFHIKNLKGRLNCYTLHGAVAKAFRANIIG
jgi:DNA-binding NarL/FixJ family response regulator